MDQEQARRESVTTSKIRTQPAGGDPVQQLVKVAVVPPRLPPNMAPPTGIGASEAIAWDESINWQHNDDTNKEEEVSKRKQFMRKAGLTTQRKRLHEDVPNFTFREVPYDVWRKHYAKDKDGFYQGTHAPAEDCLLKPEDVAKWRLEAPKTKADQYTRGRDALPVYDEAPSTPEVPAYTEDYDRPTRVDSIVPPDDPRRTSSFTADGKTSEQIIREAEEKAKIKKSRKESWRGMLRSGVNMTMGS
ncbi:hypothetical protein H2198_009038 [Neophaeococcomyces mojaviensis]|uniref:Uncharacterized protein n=1 Tax=Neophaeococcomyces mojaviensis TaxID=3383035 RepID=A0ACC2ZVS5_9EURO|nr:hypothetical protein H2198_009038 [Knufia sp. JES_112]